ncbi:MAG: hypothetical protein E7330_01310 [Clostridiales bacterium]|nr:hypothetical protein [Clostridiales bacterium]
MKRLFLLLLPLLLSACAAKSPVQSNLTVEIGNVKGIFSLAVSREHETAVAQNANNSALEENECFLFSLPEKETEFTLSAYGGAGADMGRPLFEETFACDFSQGPVRILLETDETGTLRAVPG